MQKQKGQNPSDSPQHSSYLFQIIYYQYVFKSHCSGFLTGSRREECPLQEIITFPKVLQWCS